MNASATADPGDLIRVTVDVRVEQWERLASYAHVHGITRTDAVHRAINLLHVPEMSPGAMLCVQHRDGRVECLSFPGDGSAEAGPSWLSSREVRREPGHQRSFLRWLRRWR